MKDKFSNIYLAIPEAIMDYRETVCYSNIYTTKVSEPLDYFLVRPVKGLKIIHDSATGTNLVLATVGYNEINTGKRIINVSFLKKEDGNTEVYKHDILSGTEPIVGEVQWRVDEGNPASTVLGEEGIKEYRKISKKDIIERLFMVHEQAQKLGSTNDKEKVKTKKQ